MAFVVESYPKMQYHWFNAEDLCQFMKEKYSPLKNKELSSATFTRAMNRDGRFGGSETMRRYHEGNLSGVFCNRYRPGDKSSAIFCYCFGPVGAPLPNELYPSANFVPDSIEAVMLKTKVEEVKAGLKSAETDPSPELDEDAATTALMLGITNR